MVIAEFPVKNAFQTLFVECGRHDRLTHLDDRDKRPVLQVQISVTVNANLVHGELVVAAQASEDRLGLLA
jgi:hypothetical protein